MSTTFVYTYIIQIKHILYTKYIILNSDSDTLCLALGRRGFNRFFQLYIRYIVYNLQR